MAEVAQLTVADRFLAARTDAPAPFVQPLLSPVETQNKVVNENQKALISFSQTLETQLSPVDDMGAIGFRRLKMMEGPRGQFAVTKDSFERSIHQTKRGNLDPNIGSTTHVCADDTSSKEG
ncbi:MAG TPA: hypothetical protein VFP59_16185 [Candidatus Angelobacter sp.]|nr:hypothetical protein [Candidatus Angelobacter sp.]